MELTLIKQLDNSFKLAYDSDYEKAKKIKAGEERKYKCTKPRNIKFHRKSFALLNMVYQNQEHYNNIDDLRTDLTIASGFYTKRISIHGEEIIEAKSISFASMQEHEFEKYYNAMIDSIVKYFHFDKQSIIEHIEQFF